MSSQALRAAVRRACKCRSLESKQVQASPGLNGAGRSLRLVWFVFMICVLDDEVTVGVRIAEGRHLFLQAPGYYANVGLLYLVRLV
jgi:hypothetical protein